MLADYNDLYALTDSPPTWFDEYGVPRWCVFNPIKAANIYAKQAILLQIKCQGCGEHFDVAMTVGIYSDFDFASVINSGGDISYGDPPNTGCCGVGSTMTSVPVRVKEFWEQDGHYNWQRNVKLEKKVKCSWWNEDTDDF